ncbi:hypothetical protein TrVFT333_010035 [Trichoderma virens FT-333]|nr:hypothetical protein TrVFT333_010035 [Trichoderma virens FT-333]
MNSELHAIETLAKYGANVDLLPSKGPDITPLMAAVGQGKFDVAECLLNLGAEVNYQNNLKKTALHTARTTGMIRLLLKHGGDVKMADKDGDTALHCLAQTPLPSGDDVRRLLNAGADINAKNRFGYTPLMRAIIAKNLSLVGHLLSKGADPNIADISSISPLQCACEIGNAKIVKRLYESEALTDLAIDDGYGGLLHAACTSPAGDDAVREVIQYLMEVVKVDVNQLYELHGTIDGTAVHFACFRGSSQILKLLIEKYHAKYELSNDAGHLPIHLATIGRSDCFQHLFNLGCDIHATDKTGRNLLHWAAQNGNTEAVSLILSQPDVDIDAADNDGWTALCWAARDKRAIKFNSFHRAAQVEIIELLLQKGASKFVRVHGDRNEMWKPLDIAIFSDSMGRVKELLMDQPVAEEEVGDSEEKKGHLHLGACRGCHSVSI